MADVSKVDDPQVPNVHDSTVRLASLNSWMSSSAIRLVQQQQAIEYLLLTFPIQITALELFVCNFPIT